MRETWVQSLGQEDLLEKGMATHTSILLTTPPPKKKQFKEIFGASLVQFSSVAQSCPTLCDPMNHSTPGLPVHHHLKQFTQTHVIESVMPSRYLILCCPLFLLPAIPPSIRVFSSESTLCMKWPKYWSFSYIIPSKEHPGLISFRMD